MYKLTMLIEAQWYENQAIKTDIFEVDGRANYMPILKAIAERFFGQSDNKTVYFSKKTLAKYTKPNRVSQIGISVYLGCWAFGSDGELRFSYNCEETP